jgi:hypothetical protein
MRRKNDADRELEGVAQRLRKERPEASPLELDRIKTAAMSRTRTATRGRFGARRLAIAGLTVGLLAATTGTVLAGGSSAPSGNAAVAQYGNNCDTNNNNGNGNGNHTGGEGGNNNGNGDNNYNCNENSFNTTTINNGGSNTTNITNDYTTVAATPTPTSDVLGTKSAKAKTSARRIRIHVKVPHGARLSRVTVKVNGKRVKTLKGKAASANIELINLPCSTGATKIQISVTLSDGKTVTAIHSYHLCT